MPGLKEVEGGEGEVHEDGKAEETGRELYAESESESLPELSWA